MFSADNCTFSDISDDELVSASQLVEGFVSDADLWNNCTVRRSVGRGPNDEYLNTLFETASRLCKAAGFSGFLSNH